MMMGWDNLSDLRPPTGLLFNSMCYMSKEKHGEMMSTGELIRPPELSGTPTSTVA
jgi:hypothetical protein